MTPDEYITLAEAAERTPKRPRPKTVWCWARRGITTRNGNCIRLRHVRVGCRLMTTEQWLAEFFEAVAQADLERVPVHHPNRTPATPARIGHAAADAFLREAGM